MYMYYINILLWDGSKILCNGSSPYILTVISHEEARIWPNSVLLESCDCDLNTVRYFIFQRWVESDHFYLNPELQKWYHVHNLHKQTYQSTHSVNAGSKWSRGTYFCVRHWASIRVLTDLWTLIFSPSMGLYTRGRALLMLERRKTIYQRQPTRAIMQLTKQLSLPFLFCHASGVWEEWIQGSTNPTSARAGRTLDTRHRVGLHAPRLQDLLWRSRRPG